jgi:hypothetical protein
MGGGIGLTFQSIGRVWVHLSQGPATFLEKFQMGACEFGASPILSGMNRLGEFVNVVLVKTPEHSVTTGYGTQRCPLGHLAGVEDCTVICTVTQL